MGWFEKVSEYIEDNLDVFIAHFFNSSNQVTRGRNIMLNPSPCCGHNDCFSLSKEKPVSYCFSCGEGGNRIQLVERVWGKEEGRRELEKWSNIQYQGTRNIQKETEEEKMEKRLQEGYLHVIDLYSYHLLDVEEGDEALQKQIGTDLAKGQRAHKADKLREFKVGLSYEQYELVEKFLYSKGFSKEEVGKINKMCWVPPFNYVYPYFDGKGRLIRINTKPFKRICLGKRKKDGGYDRYCTFETMDTSKQAKKAHEAETGHVMSPDGFSQGDKDFAIFKSPAKNKKKYKYCILVEGENDVISGEEALDGLPAKVAKDYVVWGVGGNIKKGFFEMPIFRQFEKIFEAFDPDDAGNGYREQLNEEAPDIKVYHLPIEESDMDDFDSYLKAPLDVESPLEYLLNGARFVETKELLFERKQSMDHEWVARNRSYELHFKVERYKPNPGQFEGILEIYLDGEPVDKKTGGIDKIGVDGTYRPAKLKLSKHLETYYNELPWELGKPVRPFDELIDLIKHTKNKSQAYKQIAHYLYNTKPQEEYNKLYSSFRNKVSDEKVNAEVLKEVNAFSNSDVSLDELSHPINLSQHFSIINDDAFFYFTRMIRDGVEGVKLVPCLLTNKKEEIRLDLFKRKDPQSLLLIKNKYELIQEVPTAVMDKLEVSLQSHWVDKWQNGEISDEEIHPSRIIKDIENFISRFYYLPVKTKKVLALWIYSTYFYMLFKAGFPYLLFTGEKGTGKSTLDLIVYLLALNAKISIDMSGPTLFRSISFEGGTFILDENENLTDKKKVDADGYATVLKGGYSIGGSVYRMRPGDNGSYSAEKFEVFGPKVISNINGLDDVIADRCIYIRTFRVDEKYINNLEEVRDYLGERRHEAHNITSRAVLSALTHFRELHDLMGKTEKMETGTARLSQILRPLQVMAKFVGGDYEENLMKFYQEDIKDTKTEISENTLEGKLKRILKSAAQEFTGIEKQKWVTAREGTLYPKDISYNPASGVFEIDNLHLKLLCEELDSELNVSLNQIHKTVRNIMGPGFTKKDWTYTSAQLGHENLQRMFKGSTTTKVYRYLFSIQDFLSQEEFKAIDKDGKSIPPLF